MIHVSQAIYLTRLQRGYSQKELARRSGVPQPNLSNIEKGKDFQVSTLYQIADALGVSPEVLLKGIQALPVDKEEFFQRQNIERVVECLVRGGTPQGSKGSVIRLFNGVLSGGRRQSKKETHLSWAVLKKTFSREEINSVLSRIEKARRRLS